MFTPLCDDRMLREADITLLAGIEVTSLDTAAHRVRLAGGRSLPYRSLLLAMGAQARPLPSRVSGNAPVYLLRTHADAIALRERLAPGVRVGVIGGGFIGLEVASSARALGCAVTVIELAPRLMGRAVPAQIAAAAAARHIAAGIVVRCGTGVAGLARTASGAAITLADGTTADVDVVVAGVGAAPVTALAARAGIAVDDGIVVDERFATSAPGVFAAGDCCCYPHPLYGGRRLRLESWRAAREHGQAAARAMLGATEPYAGVPWFWSDQHDVSLQVAGLTTVATEETVRIRPDGVQIWFGRERAAGTQRPGYERPGHGRPAGGGGRDRARQRGCPGHQAGRDAHRAAGGARPGRAGRPRRAPQVPAPRAGRCVMK